MSSTRRSLILVDLQNDFCPGGNLAVPEGDQVISVANRLQKDFDLVVASLDWHPAQHISFSSRHPGSHIGDSILVDGFKQDLWPDHCIQESPGAEFHPQLDISQIQKIVHKGTDLKIDSYSAFYDNEQLRSTGLGEYLRDKGVEEVYIMGLATDYCVKFTCRDALKFGFKVYVIEDGCRGVNLQPGDVDAAYQEMRDQGAVLIKSTDLI